MGADHRMAARAGGHEGREGERTPCHAERMRYGFGIKAVTSGVPLNTLQQFLGHAQLSTTSIYTDAMGPEKRQLVERMW